MPKFTKHVGQVVGTGKKCVVFFRTIPNEPTSCLVVQTEDIPTLYHDDIINAVENETAQEDMDFYKYAQRTQFHDGRTILEGCHQSGWLMKYPTSEIMMLPTLEHKILLSDLNTQLDRAGRTTSGDISEPSVPENKPAGVLDEKDIANQMRSQAAFFRKEAERLYKEAEALDPQTTAPAVADTPKPKRAYNKKK
jgi:hypothetical protein